MRSARTSGVPVVPPWPQADAPTATVAAYFVEHRTGFLVQAWLATTGVLLLLPMALALASLFEAHGRALAGKTIVAAMLVFCGAFGLNWIPWVEIAFRPDRSPDVIQALYDFGLLGQFIGVGAPLALLFGAFAAGTLDGKVTACWIAWLAIVQVPVGLVLAACTGQSGVFAPSGPFGFALIGTFTVWGVAVSVTLIRRGRGAGR